MGYRRLQLTLNHAQRRVKRRYIGITARGTDFEGGASIVTCPATGSVRLRANFERPEFQTSNSGPYKKLTLADYDLVDENPTPVPGSGDPALWQEWPFNASTGLWYTEFFYENKLGVAATTKETYAADQGMALSVFAYGVGNEQDGILIELGWNDAPNGDAGPSLRFFHDGRVQLYYDGRIVDQGSLTGTAGYGRAAQEYVLLSLERAQGRDLVIRTSKGGAASFRCNWVDPEDEDSHLFPASKFWWRVPKGRATVLVCPIVYDETGTGDTRKYSLAEAPGTGETLQTWVGSDRFPFVDNAHLIGHPQGGLATFALRNEDNDGAFTPDGEATICRMRLTLTSGDGGVTSPWIWGVHAGYRELAVNTFEATADVGVCLGSPVDLSLPDATTGLEAAWDFINLELLESLAPHCLDSEGTPTKIALVDPDEVLEPVMLLDGELLSPLESDAVIRSSGRASVRAIDKLQAARTSKVRETLPFDGMPFCRPATDGISAVLLCLRAMGIDDSQTDLPDLDYRMPDVPMPGADRLPTGDWNAAAIAGDLWGDVLDRLLDRAPQIVYGMRPLPGGGYGFHAFEPLDTDPPLATLYRSVEAAQTVDPELTDAEAERMLYDRATREPLPLEGNEVRVMGYDPGRRAPIVAVATWAESIDPTVAPVDRFRGWLGRPRGVEYGDPGLTRISDCTAVCEKLFEAVTSAYDLVPYEAQLPFDADGIPLWRGECAELDDFLGKGEPYKVRTCSWQLSLIDESGLGYMPEDERPPSRLAKICGGAMLGHGGVLAFQIIDLAEERARSSRRFRGWQGIEGVSPVQIVAIP